MKTIKTLLLLVAFSAVTFYSCSDDASIKNENTTKKSVALRTVLNELKTTNNIAGKSANADPANPFCFEFNYPITVSYNNGTAITIANLQGLLDVLSNETPNLFLDGIIFPFQVTQSTGTTTISNEQDFTALIQSCGFTTFQDDVTNSYCFDIIFPIQVTHDGQITTINSIEELHLLADNPANDGVWDIVFPINVMHNNQTVTVNNLYELYDIIDTCGPQPCICTQEYAPVCVQTPNGIVEFGNMCYAICAGYTQNDLVPCTPTTECFITNLTAVPGDCNPNAGTYSLTINFNPGNSTATTFEVFSSANIPVGVFPIASLPLTIPDYPISTLGMPNDVVMVKIAENNELCSATQQFTPPNCGGVCTCPPEHSPVCVRDAAGNLIQFENSCLAACAGYTPIMFENCNSSTSNFGTQLGSCFHIAYPVQVQFQGAVYTVNSDGELLQYYFPATGQIPVLNYPIVATFVNTTYTFINQAAFQAQISQSCP